MRKISYTIGYVGRSYFKFGINLKNKMGEFCMSNDVNDSLKISNLFPTLTLTISDEVRDSSSGWSLDKTLSFSRFTGARFVERGKQFIEDFKRDDLFMYRNNVLVMNKEIANQISFVEVADFERQVKVIPAIHKDSQTNQLFEAIVLMIGNVSNYVIYSYDEFISIIKFMETFDYDGLAIKLLNLAITVNGFNRTANGELIADNSKPDSVNWVDKPKTVPDLK